MFEGRPGMRLKLRRDGVCFFFYDTATTEIYTLSLHDALPISARATSHRTTPRRCGGISAHASSAKRRSEEHTSELQSQFHLVCRLLLEKKNKNEVELPYSLFHLRHFDTSERDVPTAHDNRLLP